MSLLVKAEDNQNPKQKRTKPNKQTNHTDSLEEKKSTPRAHLEVLDERAVEIEHVHQLDDHRALACLADEQKHGQARALRRTIRWNGGIIYCRGRQEE